MTDRELLEMAAKAEGQSIYKSGGEYWVRLPSGLALRWNPLTDDGDALRLAVKLRMTIITLSDSIEVYSQDNSVCAQEMTWEGEDAYVATRRAIVHTAAEIGKNMK